MKTFYLELNPFIVLGKKILSLSLHKYNRVYTSYWTIAEQIINLNKENYSHVKNSFKNINDSKIRIDWRSELDLNINAFNICIPFCLGEDLLKNSYNLVIIKNSYDEFMECKGNAANSLKQLRKISNEKLKIINHFTNSLTEIERGGNKILIRNFLYDQFFQAEVIMAANGSNVDPFVLRDRYNGRLDRYINAIVEYYSRFKNMKHNDSFDLTHLRYLENNTTYIVTDDKLIQSIDSKYMSCNDFYCYMKNLKSGSTVCHE